MTGKEIIEIAKKYLGDNGKKFCADYGMAFGNHWCCAFVWDIFRIAKASKLFYGGAKTAYVPTAQVWLKAHCKHVKMTEAKAGDIVIFTWHGGGYNREQGTRDHIGFIRAKGTATVCKTIEGNTGTGNPRTSTVKERTRDAKYVYAIYRPNYTSTVKKKKKTVKIVPGSYLDKAGKAAVKVFKAAVGCKHVNGTKATTFEKMKKMKQLSCNRTVSITLQLAGCLAKGKVIGHRKRGSGKTTVDKAMKGRKLLKHCSVHYVNKLYKDLPAKYKVRGACYIYDSNAAVSAGKGWMWSCNGGRGYNKKTGRYYKYKNGILSKGKGYSFTHKILVVILPDNTAN